MRINRTNTWLLSSMLLAGLTLVAPARVLAHCDSLDGPVVKAAQEALDSRNPALALIWVQAKDEGEIVTAFEQTLAVRALSPQARELADRFFFETLVRLHRAGEGAPFTGLKPAGRDLGPAIPAADKAIADGSLDAVLKLLVESMRDRLRDHFHGVINAKSFKTNDLTAGRAFVKVYVEFIHYVERLYEAAHGVTTGTSMTSHLADFSPGEGEMSHRSRDEIDEARPMAGSHRHRPCSINAHGTPDGSVAPGGRRCQCRR